MAQYYWLRLQKDFFKRHDVMILRRMGGAEAVLAYIHLMAESLDHDGCLRYSDTKPYTMKSLSAVVNIAADDLKYIMDILIDMELAKILEDGTIYLPKVKDMTGSTKQADNAERQRRYREKKRDECVTDALRSVTSNDSVTVFSNESIEYRDKSIEYRDKNNITNVMLSKEKEKEREKAKRFSKPTIEEIREYCRERNNGIDAEKFYDFYESKDWYVGKNRMRDFKACIRTWERREKKDNVQAGYITDGKGYKYMVNDEAVKEEDDPLKDINSILGGDL